MKINDPNLRGKIFLKYEGNNVQLLQIGIKRYITKIFDDNINGVKDNLLFNFKLHNNIEVAVSLTSLNLYVNNCGWIIHEESICNVTEIFVDDEHIIIKGVLSYSNFIDENNKYIEPYNFEFILRNIETIIKELASENVFFTDFRVTGN